MSYQMAKLAEICSMKTGKLNSNAAVPNGIYPFFTCAQETFRINKSAYNTEAVLLGGNNANGVYPLKYYKGEFNAYQRTYIFETLDPKLLNIRYLYYALRPALSQFQAASIGAATQYLTKSILDNFKIFLPKIDSQNNIVQVLSAYDDLIENNKRRIALLEESARQLYKEWFVRFRFPGHEHVKIIDGVPEGWERRHLGTWLEIKHGFAFKGEYFSDEPTKLVLMTPGNFKIGGGIKLDKKKYYLEDGPLPEEYILSEEDLLVTMTDLSKTSDTLGYPALTPRAIDQVFLHNQRLGKVTLKLNGHFPKNYFYHVFLDSKYRAFVVGSSSGTSVKHTSPKKILSFEHLMPDDLSNPLIRQFDGFANGIHNPVKVLFACNENLAKARDLILPKLMSGELAV